MMASRSLALLRSTDPIKIAPSVVSTRVGDDTLIHDMLTQEHYRLNDIGTRVWQLIDAGNDTMAVIRVITSEYSLPPDVSPDQVRGDIIAIVGELNRRGLIHP